MYDAQGKQETMISLEHVRLEDVPFIDLQPQADESNEDGIVNEPVIIA